MKLDPKTYNLKPRHLGFTLIEVLISVVILVLVITAIVSVETGNIKIGTSSKYTIQANGLGQEGVNLVKAISDKKILASDTSQQAKSDYYLNAGALTQCTNTSIVAGITVCSDDGAKIPLNGINYYRTVSFGDSTTTNGATNQKINVIISWQEGGVTKTQQFNSFLATAVSTPIAPTVGSNLAVEIRSGFHPNNNNITRNDSNTPCQSVAFDNSFSEIPDTIVVSRNFNMYNADSEIWDVEDRTKTGFKYCGDDADVYQIGNGAYYIALSGQISGVIEGGVKLNATVDDNNSQTVNFIPSFTANPIVVISKNFFSTSNNQMYNIKNNSITNDNFSYEGDTIGWTNHSECPDGQCGVYWLALGDIAAFDLDNNTNLGDYLRADSDTIKNYAKHNTTHHWDGKSFGLNIPTVSGCASFQNTDYTKCLTNLKTFTAKAVVVSTNLQLNKLDEDWVCGDMPNVNNVGAQVPNLSLPGFAFDGFHCNTTSPFDQPLGPMPTIEAANLYWIAATKDFNINKDQNGKFSVELPN